MSRHYSRDELLGYFDDNDAIVDLRECADHLTGCEACAEAAREVVIDYEVLKGAFGESVWRSDVAPPPSRMAEFLLRLNVCFPRKQ